MRAPTFPHASTRPSAPEGSPSYAAGIGKSLSRAVARYNSDGSLDAGFGADGRVSTDFFAGSDGANAVSVQSVGRIVAAGGAGSATGDFALARYKDGGGIPTPGPSLTIDKTHTGNFIRGGRGEYTLTVRNDGSAPTDGTTVTVQGTLPAGLTASRIAGPGWNCVRSTCRPGVRVARRA
ncbi:hypothetical protein ACFY7C_00015 [Streptomyces sp. NPDC012769]|uniref:hypothetical protein n=1 Tax=Streptomyces sp. NPDC012769 TaxID=3364848 RepID=UPI0036C73027